MHQCDHDNFGKCLYDGALRVSYLPLRFDLAFPRKSLHGYGVDELHAVRFEPVA
jgi:hypothetical protein